MIREAQFNDINDINNLGECLNNNFSNTYNLDNYINDNKYILLIHEDKSIDAFLLIFKNIDNYEIEALAVKKEKRRQGIAHELFNYFFSTYLKKNDIVLLEVASNNNDAINLYQSLGFTIVNIRKKYYKDIDALIMKKVI